MHVRSNHDMTAGIRIQIQENEVVLPAMHDETGAIISGFRFFAENARLVSCSRAYITISPGTPEPVHQNVGGCSGGVTPPAFSDEPSGPFTRSFNSLLGLK